MTTHGHPSTSRTPSHPHPITLLPVEILSEIMCYMPLFYDNDAPTIRPLDRDLDPSGRFTKDSPIRTPHWVAVSHVCHLWREVAFKCKALWTCIPLVSPRWAQHALALSHPHPITLRVDSGDSSLDRGYVSVEALCLALAHLSRVRKIRIHSPWGTRYGDRIMSIVYGALCGGAPALEELDLASEQLPFQVRSGPDRTAMVSAIARLRVLCLDQCHLPEDTFLLHRGLTHLRVSGSQVMWPTLESMLHGLASVPKLEVLELYGVLPSGHAASDPPPSCDLPFLKELHVDGTRQSILVVLKALILSDNVQVFVTLPASATENGSRSRWLMKLHGRQGSASGHCYTDL